MMITTLLMLQGRSGGGVVNSLVTVIWLGVMVTVFIAYWKVFVKAGRPGWAILVPFYNAYVFLKIAGRPGWWLLLFLIPLVNIVIGFIVTIDIAKSFGKGVGFAMGLIFLGPIFYAILGFGQAEYKGPAAA